MHQANQNELNFGAGRAEQRRAMKETHAHTNTKKEEEYADRSVQISVDSVYFTTIAKWIFHMCDRAKCVIYIFSTTESRTEIITNTK